MITQPRTGSGAGRGITATSVTGPPGQALYTSEGIRPADRRLPGRDPSAGPGLGILRDSATARPAKPYSTWGRLRWQTGDYPAAAQLLDQVLGVYATSATGLAGCLRLSAIGTVQRVTGDYTSRAQLWSRPWACFCDVADRVARPKALNVPGAAPGAGTLDKLRLHQQARNWHAPVTAASGSRRKLARPEAGAIWPPGIPSDAAST